MLASQTKAYGSHVPSFKHVTCWRPDEPFTQFLASAEHTTLNPCEQRKVAVSPVTPRRASVVPCNGVLGGELQARLVVVVGMLVLVVVVVLVVVGEEVVLDVDVVSTVEDVEVDAVDDSVELEVEDEHTGTTQ